MYAYVLRVYCSWWSHLSGAHPWNRLINFPFQRSLIVYSSCLRVRAISISHKNRLVVLVKVPYQCWHVDLLLIFRSLICLFVFRQLHSLDFKGTASLSYREDTLTADALILWLLESLPILFCPWAVGIGVVSQMDQLGLDTTVVCSLNCDPPGPQLLQKWISLVSGESYGHLYLYEDN